MRAILQRVNYAEVTVDNVCSATIGPGLLVLLGVAKDDSESAAEYLADKIASLRIFPDDDGKMNRSVAEAGGSLLIVSNFTLYADTRKGRRPAFDQAAPPDAALRLYDYFVGKMKETGIPVATGVFQAHMQIRLENDGPVTLICESK